MKYKYSLILLILFSFALTGCSTIQKIAEFNLEHLDVENEITTKEYLKLPESTYVKDTVELAMDNVKTLNPLDGVPYNVDQGLKLVYESLFVPDEYFAIEPILVSSYEQLNDTSYRITIKDHVFFHNDLPLTAQDVVFSFEYIKKQVDSGYVYVNNYVSNIYAESDQTLIVEFFEKNRYNLYALTFPIISQEYLESDQYIADFPIGTGPYQCQRFQSMIELKLIKNLNYHGQIPEVNYIRFTFVRAFSEEYNMFLSKRIDLISPIQTHWPNYSDDQNIQKKQYLSPYFYYIGFNHTNETYQNRDVRRYYSSYIDYQQMNHTIFLNHLYFTPLPLYLESEIQGQLMDYDVFESQDVNSSFAPTIDEAVRFIYLQDDDIQVNIIKNLKASMNTEEISIEFIGLGHEEYYISLNTGDFDMYLNTYQASIIPSLDQIIGSNGRYNYGKYSNQNVDGLLASYHQVETNQQYVNQLNSLGDWIMTEVPIIPIGFLENGMFIHNKIEGTITPNYFYLYKNIQGIKITDS